MPTDAVPCTPHKATDSRTRECNAHACQVVKSNLARNSVAAVCSWCRCKDCSICAGKDATSPIFPSAVGHWTCNRPDISWVDGGRASTTSSVVSRTDMSSALANRWLVFVGDSSVRMLFHYLVGILALGWEAWPHEESFAWPSRTSTGNQSCLDSHRTDCVEDAVVNGVRLTGAWVDYGEEDQPHARLSALVADAVNTPDAFLLSVGSWWAMHRYNDSQGYRAAVTTQMHQLERLLAERPPSGFRGQMPNRAGDLTRLVFLSTTSCSRAFPKPDSMTFSINHLNRLARQQVLARPRWEWFDRAVVTGAVCNRTRDCAGAGIKRSSRFHPSGRALNVLTNLLVARIHAPSPLPWVAPSPGHV